MSRAFRLASAGILASALLVGCDRKEPVGTGAPPASSLAPPAPAAPSGAPVPGVAAAPAAVTPTTFTAVPETWEGATKVDVENAVGVSCEPKVLGEWLRFTCFKKTGTGGKPKRAVMPALGLPNETTIQLDGADAGAGTPMREVLPDESGMVQLVVPWKAGYKADGFIEWTDTRYLLRVDGESAKLAWDVTVPLRKTCAELERARDRLAGEAVKAGTVTDAEAKKLPRFGRCQPAGWGSWAVGATSLVRAPEVPKLPEPKKPAEPEQQFGIGRPKAREAAKPMVQAALEMIWVGMDGKTTRAPMGTVDFVADKLLLPRIVAYDYDDDGRDEAVVLYDLNGYASEAAPKVFAPIWAFDGNAVAAYAKAPGLLAGSLFTEQLDSDMRPDLGHFGPFVAWPPVRCGEVTCPDRLTGPKLFAHSRADGTFSHDDDAARAAGKRMCSSRPSPVVAGKTNVTRTAHNVGCARLWGVSTEELSAELRAAAPTLCGAEPECELLKILLSWAAIKPPFEIK